MAHGISSEVPPMISTSNFREISNRVSFVISTGISLGIFLTQSHRISLEVSPEISLRTCFSRKTLSGVAPWMSLMAFQDLSWNFSQEFFRDFSWSSFWDWDLKEVLLIFSMKLLPRFSKYLYLVFL